MIAVQETAPGVFTEIARGMSFEASGVLHPWQVAELWSDEDLAAIGVYRVEPAEIPPYKAVTNTSYERDETSKVIQVLTLEDAPIESVSASSAKLVLDDDGIYEAVETICVDHPVLAVRIYWTTAATWERGNPYVQAIGMEMELSDEQMDDMFRRATLK